MLTFRMSITLAVMAFVAALAALLIFTQFWTLHIASKEAASARMDAVPVPRPPDPRQTSPQRGNRRLGARP
jgi:hypothetical protein